MNRYVEDVIAYVKKNYSYQPEFVQTVEEVFTSIAPVVDAHPEYERADLLKRMVEPERMFRFRVVWTDDDMRTTVEGNLTNGNYNHKITFTVDLSYGQFRFEDFNIGRRVDFYTGGKLYHSVYIY